MQISLNQLTLPNFKLWIGVSERGLVFVGAPNGAKDEINNFYDPATIDTAEISNLAGFKKWFVSYFAGRKSAMPPIDRTIGTDFQKRVWRTLEQVTYGTTVSYGELAEKMGQKTAARAVAHAVSHNPVMYLVPCHRVIKSDGKIGQYSAGPELKAALLKMESQGGELEWPSTTP